MSRALRDSQVVVHPDPAQVQGRHRLSPLVSENSARRLAPHTWVLTWRVLLRWRRDSATMFESLIMPVVLLITVDIVLGDGITQLTGQNALYGSVPMIAMAGVMDGAMVSGIRLMRERSEGLLSRLWVLPVHRASGVVSRLTADLIRIEVTTATILLTGVVLGFRFHQGAVAAIAWMLVPLALGLAFSATVITISLYASNTVMVEATEIIWAVLMFFSTGFVPLDQYPKWIQPLVQHQPLSLAIETMRGLSVGGEVRGPLIEMLIWAAVIICACAIPMVLGYRKASMRG